MEDVASDCANGTFPVLDTCCSALSTGSNDVNRRPGNSTSTWVFPATGINTFSISSAAIRLPGEAQRYRSSEWITAEIVSRDRGRSFVQLHLGGISEPFGYIRVMDDAVTHHQERAPVQPVAQTQQRPDREILRPAPPLLPCYVVERRDLRRLVEHDVEHDALPLGTVDILDLRVRVDQGSNSCASDRLPLPPVSGGVVLHHVCPTIPHAPHSLPDLAGRIGAEQPEP